MATVSLQRWQSDRATSLDEIEEAHRSIGGTGPGRRYATQQINQAYAVLLSAQFQAFCRDLHTESAAFLINSVQPIVLQPILLDEFGLFRKLDQGNPNPGNIGSDFNRLGIDLWAKSKAADRRTAKRQKELMELNEWRNAIAHQDFNPSKLGGLVLTLGQVRSWRGACNGLAATFDHVLADHIGRLLGAKPW